VAVEATPEDGEEAGLGRRIGLGVGMWKSGSVQRGSACAGGG
jgi:hypothetical protein